MIHGSAVAIVRKDGAVLLQLRDKNLNINYPNCWALPGGGTEEGEAYEETARRELLEETGYNATDLYFLLEEKYVSDKNEESTRHIYWTKYDGKQKLKCLEGQELKFIHPKNFKKLKFIPNYDRISLVASRILALKKSKSS